MCSSEDEEEFCFGSVGEEKEERKKKERWSDCLMMIHRNMIRVDLVKTSLCKHVRCLIVVDMTMTCWSMHFGLMLVRLYTNTETAASRLISKKTWWSLHQRPALLAFWFSPNTSCVVLAMSSKASYSSLKDSEWSLTTLGKGAENGQSTMRPTRIFSESVVQIMAM